MASLAASDDASPGPSNQNAVKQSIKLNDDKERQEPLPPSMLFHFAPGSICDLIHNLPPDCGTVPKLQSSRSSASVIGLAKESASERAREQISFVESLGHHLVPLFYKDGHFFRANQYLHWDSLSPFPTGHFISCVTLYSRGEHSRAASPAVRKRNIRRTPPRVLPTSQLEFAILSSILLARSPFAVGRFIEALWAISPILSLPPARMRIPLWSH